MHNAIHSVFGPKLLRFHLTMGLAAMLLLVTVIPGNAQLAPLQQEIFDTVFALSDEQVAQLVNVTAVLNESEDSIGLFLEAPRDYLLNEGINLPHDEFQIIGVSFALPPAIEDEPWFGIAEPLDGLVYEPKGLGIFYSNVAILIQEAHEPVGENAAVEEVSQQADILRFIIDEFTEETLDLVRNVMRELEEMDSEDPRRLEFLANPREYLINQNLTLPALTYRIIAIDLNRAEAAGSVVSDIIRPGLGTVKAGVGVFYDNVGIFVQRAV